MSSRGFESRYFTGDNLYGDNLSLEQIAKWFEDGKHGLPRTRSGQSNCQ